jgi:hypothetical protein
MSNLIGKFEDYVDLDKDDTSLEPYEQDEDSIYWIHRTTIPQLYFNTNYKINNCPIILTYEELQEYYNQGKEIKDCISLDVYYSIQEEKSRVDSIISEEELERLVLEKINSIIKSFFERGIYMPEQYSKDIERVANQVSAHKLQKLVDKDNFGFNGYRLFNIAFILELPLDEDGVTIDLPEPIELDTAYLGTQKIPRSISPQYIKCAVFRAGNKQIYIKNPKYINKELNDMLDDPNIEPDDIKKDR